MEGWCEGFLQVLSDVAVGYSDNDEGTSCMYFTKHFSHLRDLPKSRQEVSKRQSILGSTHVEEEEIGSKQLSDFPHMT